MEVERLRALEAYQVGGTLTYLGGRLTGDSFSPSIHDHDKNTQIRDTHHTTKRTQNRDKQRLVEQQRGAAILREQLAERERQRLAAEELRDQVRVPVCVCSCV